MALQDYSGNYNFFIPQNLEFVNWDFYHNYNIWVIKM